MKPSYCSRPEVNTCPVTLHPHKRVIHELPKTYCTFYPFIVTVNNVEHPQNTLAPAITYITAAINIHSLTSLSFFFLS